MSYPAVRKAIASGLAAQIKEHFPDVEVIAGTATAGIPHAAWVADILDLPMVYIRSKAKDHGKGNQIEGRITEGQKMVVIEDCEAAAREGANVLGVAAIFTYELPQGLTNFEKAQLPLVTLTNYSTMIDTALEMDYIGKEDIALLQQWKQSPQTWTGK